MPDLGGFLFGALFLAARLDGLPPWPLQLINFLGLGAPKAADLELPPNRLPFTLNACTIFKNSLILITDL